MSNNTGSNPIAVFKNDLEALAADKKHGLPVALQAYGNIKPEQFVRAALTAVQETPEVARADRKSLAVACLKLASMGLVPDGREATITVRSVKRNGSWVKVAVAMPMYYGIVKSLKENGAISHCIVDIVREGDTFTYGTTNGQAYVTHNPQPFSKGDPLGAYAAFTLTDGNLIVEVMSAADMESIRNSSDSAFDKDGNPSKFSPWTNQPMEMWKKSVVRRGSKRIPVINAQVRDVLEADNEAHGLVTMDVTSEEGEPQDDTQSTQASRLDQLEGSITGDGDTQADDSEPPFDVDVTATEDGDDTAPSDEPEQGNEQDEFTL